MKILKMIRGFFVKWSRSSKIMQNIFIFIQDLVSPRQLFSQMTNREESFPDNTQHHDV